MKTIDIVLELSDKIRTLEAENKSLKTRICSIMKPFHDFRKMRKNKGFTLRRVEETTGISNAYLSQLENGKIKNPSFSTVIRLYECYK